MSATGSVFTGLKVLDLASFIAGPAAATILGDFGADVIKIEAPGGDPYRALSDLPGMPRVGADYHWALDNRNKRGLMLDLRSDAGREVLDLLLADTDVVVTNFMPGVRKRLRLAYEDVKAVNPKIIYAVITGYGETGAEADKPGFDSSALWARSGLMDYVKPDPAGPPARSAPGQGDHPTAVSLFAAIVTALYHRERTGEGQQVDTSLLANGLWSHGYLMQAALCGVEVPRRPPRDRFFNALTNNYVSRDGHWFILSMVNEEREWDSLCGAIERPDLARDPRFATRADRHANPKALIEELDAAFRAKGWADWQRILDAARITFADITTLEQVPDDMQAIDSGALMPFDGLGDKASHTIDSPLWLRGAAKVTPRRAPTLAEHEHEILQGLGLDADRISELRDAGAFGSAAG